MTMLHGCGDSLENYLSRFRLRILTEEWLEVVARAHPDDPFVYLIGLIEGYIRDGRGLVTCENRWCEMVMPASEYATHLDTCSQEGKWVKCTRCNTRVEVACMGQHKLHCQLECCIYCGEMVVPRLMNLCPYKLKMDAERASRIRGKVLVSQDDKLRNEQKELTLNSHVLNGAVDSSNVSYSRVPLDFPERLKQTLVAFQNLWRSTVVKERIQDVTFKYVWDAVQMYRENQATRERIAVPGVGATDPLTNIISPLSFSVGETSNGRISMADFEAVAKMATSGAVVGYEMAARIVSCASSILASRPLVQRVAVPEGGDVVVIGDLHGQMKDLRQVLMLMGGLPNQQRYFVFNGDFVDRGPNGMEIILYIYSLLCAFPDFVFLNRGNHEDSSVNAEYGFETEVYVKYGMHDAKKLLELLLLSYEAMPLITVLDGAILILHGGVPRVPVTLDQIEAVGRMRHIPTSGEVSEEEQIVVDILWNDPVDKFRSRQLGLRHQGQNWRTSKRGCGVEYLAPITEEFLRLNNLKLIVRSHEMVQAGSELVHNGTCCTVFSASNYLGVSGNRAAVAVFQKGSLHPIFHTWYVRDEEGEGGSPTMRVLLRNFMLSTSIHGDAENHDDSGGTGGEEDEGGSGGDGNGDGDKTWEKKRHDNERCDDREGVNADSMDGKLLYRLNVLKELSDIIYRKRHALLSGFVAADYKQSGIIYKIEWCDIMRSVLEVDLPWYFLCQFVAVQEELGGVPCVRYVPFLRRFTARFSSRYLLPFQTAILKRVFSQMDLPDDLLKSLNNDEITPACKLNSLKTDHQSNSSSTRSPSFSSSTARSRKKSMFPAPQDSSGCFTSKRSSFAESWRSLKLDFNLLVSTLRSKSIVAASLEDNAMYALFQYLDQDQSGHVVLGDLVDLVESTLDDGEEEVVEVLDSDDTLDMSLNFGMDNMTAHVSGRGGDGNDAVADSVEAATVATTLQTKKNGEREQPIVTFDDTAVTHAVDSLTKRLDTPRTSFSVVTSGVGNDDTVSCNQMRTNSRQSISCTACHAKEDATEAIWLYPALLRLHESFEFGSMMSLRKSFEMLNPTNDGHLTFEQLNLAMGLIGRKMLTPLTQEQCWRIFCAIRDEGQRISNAHLCSTLDDRTVLQSEISVPNVLEDPASPPEETEIEIRNNETAPHEKAYITMQQFVSFFFVSPTGSRERRLISFSDGNRTQRVRESFSTGLTIAWRNKKRSLIEANRSRRQSDVLNIWTVNSLLSAFDGSSTLNHVLQELLGSLPSMPVQPPTQERCQPTNRIVFSPGNVTTPKPTISHDPGLVVTDSMEQRQEGQQGETPIQGPSPSSPSFSLLTPERGQQHRVVFIRRDRPMSGSLEVVGRGPKTVVSRSSYDVPKMIPEVKRPNGSDGNVFIAPRKTSLKTSTTIWKERMPCSQMLSKRTQLTNHEVTPSLGRSGLHRTSSKPLSLRFHQHKHHRDVSAMSNTLPLFTPQITRSRGVAGNRMAPYSSLPTREGSAPLGRATMVPFPPRAVGSSLQQRLHLL